MVIFEVTELAEPEGHSEECYSCLFPPRRREEEQDRSNCSLVLSSSQCRYCNTTAHCQSGRCRHFNLGEASTELGLPDNVLGLCHHRAALRTVFPKDPLGRIISFGLLGIVISVVSFIFLR